MRATVDPGVEANTRLTGSIGVVLLALLLLGHALIGFLLIPAVLLKLGG